MNLDQRLDQIADRYRSQGYRVVVRPGPDELPAFAKDFEVEILAERPDGNVLASARGDASDLENDGEMSRYAGAIDEKPGWRYDVFILGPDPEPTPEKKDAAEPSEEDVRQALANAERMTQAGFTREALLAAWAALEAAMRSRLRAEGKEAGWGSSPRTLLNELYSDGLLQNRVFRELESLYRSRNALAHGFTIPSVAAGDVQFLVETTRKLLEETRAARKTA